MGLHGIVVDHGKGKVVFKDLIGLGKTLIHVTLLHMLVAADIVLQVFMDQRCILAVLHRANSGPARLRGQRELTKS